MQLDLKSALQALNTVEQSLRDLAKPVRSKPSTAGYGPRDSVELSQKAQQGAVVQSPTATQLYADLSDQLSSLTGLIRNETAQQKKLGALFADPAGEQAIQARAQELLDGYFNAENTASRIFDFAFSFYDGARDREDYAREFKGYIDEGFRQAEKVLGGLADVSLETKQLIDEKINGFIEGEGDSSESAGGTEDGS